MIKADKLQKHVIYGITRTIPFIVLFSVVIALQNNVSYFDLFSEVILYSIPIIITVLISYSYKRFDIFLPAITLGILTTYMNVGILGGIITGTLLIIMDSILTKYIPSNTKHIAFLNNVILTIILVPLLYYVIHKGIYFVLIELNDYILDIPITSIYLIVIMLVTLMTVDLGGPFNKLAFSITIEFFINNHYHIVGPVLACVMVPPLALLISTYIYKDRFNSDDLKQRPFAILSSIVGMSEGALVISFRRVKIIPVLIIGSLVTSIIAVSFGLENMLLLSGLPALFGVNSIVVYFASVFFGCIVIISILPFVIKKNSDIIINS